MTFNQLSSPDAAGMLLSYRWHEPHGTPWRCEVISFLVPQVLSWQTC